MHSYHLRKAIPQFAHARPSLGGARAEYRVAVFSLWLHHFPCTLICTSFPVVAGIEQSLVCLLYVRALQRWLHAKLFEFLTSEIGVSLRLL